MFSAFLKQGFSLLPKKQVSVNETIVEGVWNLARHSDEKSHGGFEPDNEALFIVSTSLLTNPKALIGKPAIADGETWRVLKVSTGETFTHLTLVSDDKS